MYTPVEFVVELVTDVFRLAIVFVQEVVLGVDPLTAVSFVVGQVFVIGAVAVFAYAAVGALLDAVGIELPAIGRTKRS